MKDINIEKDYNNFTSNCTKKDKFMKELFNEYLPTKDNLIQMLDEIQEHYGYISEQAQKDLSEFLKVSISEIYGIIKFYPRFTIKAKGKYQIAVCLGKNCYINGSQRIINRLKERLKINIGETTKDGLFSIEEKVCFGACGQAPVFAVNGELYKKATVKKLDEVLDKLEKENIK